jgi:C1A family cysteine protease
MLKGIVIILCLSSLYLFYEIKKAPQNIIMEEMLLKDPAEVFKVWHHLFEKTKEYTYGSEEYNTRFTYFKKKLLDVNSHNADKTKTWTETTSIFADRSPEEMANMFNSKTIKRNVGQMKDDIGGFYNVDVENSKTVLPTTKIDWTPKSKTVYDQNPCGCCYAFAAADAIETNYYLYNDIRPSVSRQQIVDCSKENNGCNGGNPQLAMGYLWGAGANTNEEYPFVGTQQTCKANASTGKKYVKHAIHTNDINNGFPATTLFHLLTKGAVVIAIDGNTISNYGGGILNLSSGCTQSNHAILLLGYDPVGDYFIAKNSWNTWWGESGFIRIKRNSSDTANNYHCFMYVNPGLAVPEVKKYKVPTL